MKSRACGLICLLLCSSAVMASWGVVSEVASAAPTVTSLHQLTDKQRLLRVERQMHYLLAQKSVEKLAAMQGELRELRGQLEQNVHTIEAQKKLQAKFYEDLDARVSGLQLQVSHALTQAKKTKSVTVKHEAPGIAPVAQGDLTSYKLAFALLQDNHHEQAIVAFDTYLKQFPQGKYCANAWYWLGAIYLQTTKFDLAMPAFQHVVQDYPGSQKVPASWYKIATIYHSQGKQIQAKESLNTIVTVHGGDSMAKIAKKALKTWW